MVVCKIRCETGVFASLWATISALNMLRKTRISCDLLSILDLLDAFYES